MNEFVLITRDGCVACDRFKRVLDFERVPYEVKRVNEDLSRDDLVAALEEAGISSRMLPFVADREGNLMTSEDFKDRFLHTTRRFDTPQELVEHLAGVGTYRVRFTKKNGRDKIVTGSIPPDESQTNLKNGSRVSLYDEIGESWCSFYFDSVKSVERIQ